MNKEKILMLLFIFFITCGKVYEDAEVYIKTVSGYEYTCKKCDVYLTESPHWDEDEISVVKYVEGYSANEEFEIYKSKISEIRIKLNHQGR